MTKTFVFTKKRLDSLTNNEILETAMLSVEMGGGYINT